mmetsp:Transcript_16443/g.33689  ORF Transcript_16443/g.33689 Transcript_16443/m.33689 type:complete len:297 (-) Transcript_16443:129-1019(-)
MRPSALVALLVVSSASAWTSPSAGIASRSAVRGLRSAVPAALATRGPLDGDASVGAFDPLGLSSSEAGKRSSPFVGASASAIAVAAAFGSPSVASAATKAPDAIPSALAAYGHYLSILVIVASIMTERLTVKPAMSKEEEQRIAIADIMTGVSGTALLVSGYYRATAYGKGWDFYSHEPIFWLKMTSLGIFGALSLFPTITIIQRSVKIQQEGSIEPMSEELAKRMTSILNAELSALALIPLTATLMSRGVGYVDGFPTQIAGPALFGVVTAGAVYKYVKDALAWDEGAYITASKE